MGGLLISDAAKRAGVSPPTIRYYEDIGLLPAPPRSSGGYRRYSESTVHQLQFIRKAQALGFSLDEIGDILQLSRSGKGPCAHVLSLAHEHLAAVDERIRQLQRFRRQLAAELTKWDQQKTAVTCDGLCQFIADSDTDVTGEDVKLHLKPGRAQRAKETRR